MIEKEGGFSVRWKDADPGIPEVDDVKKRVAGLKDLKVRRAETSNQASFIPTNNPIPLKFEKSETLLEVAKYRPDYPW